MFPLLIVAASGAALAGAAGLVTNHHRRSSSRVHDSEGRRALGGIPVDGQVVVVKQDERLVCVRRTSRGRAVVSLSELLYTDCEYPSRSLFLVRQTASGVHILMPLHLPDKALAATGDYNCPLQVIRTRQRCGSQLWIQTTDGFVSSVNSQVMLSVIPMQPVPAAQIASWLRKAAQEGVLVRQREALERQLVGKIDLQRQLEHQVYALDMQLKEEQKERKLAQLGVHQASQQLQALSQALEASQAEGLKAKADAEALRGFMAQRQTTHSREQEHMQQLLASSQDLAARLQSRVAALEQQQTALASSLAGKDQQVVQLSQQLSNLQVAFDCVKATASERHQELLQWKEKHAKLDLALQAIKARMRMVSDGEQRVRHLQTSGVLRQADLQQLKQRLNLLSKHRDIDEAGGAAADESGDVDGPTMRGIQAVLAEEPGGSDAVEEVVRELQFESKLGSMEALLRSNGAGSGSGKAGSLAAWFGRSSKASFRSLMADSAASTSSLYGAQQLCHEMALPCREVLVREATMDADSDAGYQPLDQDAEGAAAPSMSSAIKLPGSSSRARHWVRPLSIVTSQDTDADATCNLASARHRHAPSSGTSNPASARGEEGPTSRQLTPRPATDPCPSSGSALTPGRSACTPSSPRSHNEEYDILSEDRDGYDPGLSPSHQVPGSMLLTTLLSSGKQQPSHTFDDDDDDDDDEGTEATS